MHFTTRQIAYRLTRSFGSLHSPSLANLFCSHTFQCFLFDISTAENTAFSHYVIDEKLSCVSTFVVLEVRPWCEVNFALKILNEKNRIADVLFLNWWIRWLSVFVQFFVCQFVRFARSHISHRNSLFCSFKTSWFGWKIDFSTKLTVNLSIFTSLNCPKTCLVSFFECICHHFCVVRTVYFSVRINLCVICRFSFDDSFPVCASVMSLRLTALELSLSRQRHLQIQSMENTKTERMRNVECTTSAELRIESAFDFFFFFYFSYFFLFFCRFDCNERCSLFSPRRQDDSSISIFFSFTEWFCKRLCYVCVLLV